MIKHRRELHKIPELCYAEFKTSAYIQKALKKIGHKFQTVGTGVIVHIKGTDPKRTVGFRADMDALKIEEQHQSDYISRHKGYMHACGHDGHVAMLLGLAQFLKNNPPRDNVVLVFQPAEEGGLGAQVMVEHGKFTADVFYALHVSPELELGKIETRNMAGAEEVEITFTGRSRHASKHNGKEDAIVAAAKFITMAEALNQDGFIFHTGKMHGGEVVNAIAEKATIYATMRFFDTKRLAEAHKKLEQIAQQIEKQDIAKVTFEYDPKVYMPLINTPAQIKIIEKLDGFTGIKQIYGAEDFALFIKKFTGAMIWVGAKLDGKYPIHSNKFTFDENALAVGLEIFKKLLCQTC